MSNNDLTHLLDGWPFDPGRINARLIDGEDGKSKIQVRIPLGVLQMEAEGRPDGQRPQGHDSLLSLQSQRLQRYADETGGVSGFVLAPQECRDLREEIMQLGHRLLALFAMECFDAVRRDAEHALGVLDLLRDFAASEDDRVILQELRPHVLAMRCRALASLALRDGEGSGAVAIINEGIDAVTQALGELGMGDRIEESNELRILRGMRDALVPKLPGSARAELRARLHDAIASENYELASILRDELRLME